MWRPVQNSPELLDSEKLAEATKELSADVEMLLVSEESGSPAAADMSVVEPTGDAAISNVEAAVNPNEVSLAHAYEDAVVVQPAPAAEKEEEAELPSSGGRVDSDDFAPSPSKPKAEDASLKSDNSFTAMASGSDDPFASFAPSPTKAAVDDGFAPTLAGSGAAYDPFAPSPVKDDGFASTPAASRPLLHPMASSQVVEHQLQPLLPRASNQCQRQGPGQMALLKGRKKAQARIVSVLALRP